MRRLVFVDEDGASCGIISVAHIARAKMVRKTAKVVEEVAQPFGIPSKFAVSV